MSIKTVKINKPSINLQNKLTQYISTLLLKIVYISQKANEFK